MHAVEKHEQRKPVTTQRDEREKATEFKCSKCGYSHKPASCPAYGKSCNTCGKNNQFSKCCRADKDKGKKIKKKVYAVEEDSDSDSTFVCDSVQTCEKADKAEWIVPIEVNKTVIPFKLDTGAQVNLLSMEDYKTLTVKSKILPVKMKVTGYTGDIVPVKGSCIATFKNKGRQIKAQLLIVDECTTNPWTQGM